MLYDSEQKSEHQIRGDIEDNLKIISLISE